MEEHICSVSELNGYIKALMDGDRTLQSVLVRGELSNYKVYPSGHHYFTLKDKEASLRCVMFRNSAARLVFRPENGMSVICQGSVTVYPRDGAYQLYASRMSPEGVGDLYLAYEQLRQRLEEEGLFSREHKKPLPAFPQRIAVITSGSGAAVRDVIRVLGKRFPMAKVLVLPVRVQGTEAPAEIVGALRYVNRWKLAELIITGRGGGSLEDLWAFNDERVARAIYASEIPVISAVGHEPDVTIADFAADCRAATPSNGAELAVPDQQELYARLASLRIRAEQAMQRRLTLQRRRLTELSTRPVLTDPEIYFERKRMETDRMNERMLAAAEHLMQNKRAAFSRLCASMDALSPLKVLGRGYSVVRNGDGRVISDAASLTRGERVRVTMARGALDCRIEEIKEESGNGRNGG